MTRTMRRTPQNGRWLFMMAIPGDVTVSWWDWTDDRGCDELGAHLVERYRCHCGWQTEGSESQCQHDYREHRAAGCGRAKDGAP